MKKNPLVEISEEKQVDEMDMQEVIQLVNTNRGNGKKKNLNRMKRLMELLGNPQNELRFVHIAGTNGKGSTSAFLASILKQSHLRTGLFTSPHLITLNERIRIDGQDITDGELIETTKKVRGAVAQVEEETGERLYAFEILTAVALLYFKEQESDLVILETGVGGRLDATNIIETPEAAVITSIGLDHTKVLGNTLEEIAAEKAGIIKQKGTVVTYPQTVEIEHVFRETCEEKAAQWLPVSLADIHIKETSIDGQLFDYKGKPFKTKMIGEHQVYNAAVAIEAAACLQQKGWAVSDDHIRRGIAEAFWPGRMEKVLEKPLMILDGAHNLQGVQMLRKNVAALFPDQKITFLVGMMQDKAYREMIRLVEDKAKDFLLLAPYSERAKDADQLKEELAEEGTHSISFSAPEKVVQYIQKELPKEDIVVVFGSLYLVGDIRKVLFHQ